MLKKAWCNVTTKSENINLAHVYTDSYTKNRQAQNSFQTLFKLIAKCNFVHSRPVIGMCVMIRKGKFNCFQKTSNQLLVCHNNLIILKHLLGAFITRYWKAFAIHLINKIAYDADKIVLIGSPNTRKKKR